MKTKQLIKQLRQGAGYSQEELARILKVSVFTVNRWENESNDYTPRDIWIEKIKRVCKQK